MLIKFSRSLIKFLILFLFSSYSLPVLAQEHDSDSTRVTIAVPGKTGTPLVIDGKVLGSDGNVVEGADLRIYHTDANGFYARDESGIDKGWRHADYSARLKSGPDGKFEVKTIRPVGYPDSINPAHLHIRVAAPGYPELEYTAYFEGGERITEEVSELLRRLKIWLKNIRRFFCSPLKALRMARKK